MKKIIFFFILTIHLSQSPMMFQVSPGVLLARYRNEQARQQKKISEIHHIRNLIPHTQLWNIIFKYLDYSMLFEKEYEMVSRSAEQLLSALHFGAQRLNNGAPAGHPLGGHLDPNHFVVIQTSGADTALQLWNTGKTLEESKLVRTFSTENDKMYNLKKFDHNLFFTLSRSASSAFHSFLSSFDYHIKIWHKDFNKPIQIIHCAGKEPEKLHTFFEGTIFIQSRYWNTREKNYETKLEAYVRQPTKFELLFRAHFPDKKKNPRKITSKDQ